MAFGDQLEGFAERFVIGPLVHVRRVVSPAGLPVLMQSIDNMAEEFEVQYDSLADAKDELENWLRENVGTTDTAEIHLVERRRFRMRVRGVLYATLYKWRRDSMKRVEAADEDTDCREVTRDTRVFVWYILLDTELSVKDAGDVAGRLWDKLQDIVEVESKERAAEQCPYEQISPRYHTVGSTSLS